MEIAELRQRADDLRREVSVRRRLGDTVTAKEYRNELFSTQRALIEGHDVIEDLPGTSRPVRRFRAAAGGAIGAPPEERPALAAHQREPLLADGTPNPDCDPNIAAAFNAREAARTPYVEARRNAGSSWKALAGLLKRNTVGKRLGVAREAYEEANEEYTSLVAEAMANEALPDYFDFPVEIAEYQQRIAQEKTILKLKEMRTLAQAEYDRTAPGKVRAALERVWGDWRLKVTAGALVNIGIVASAAVGAIPVTVPLLGLKLALGTVGNKAGMDGVRDFYHNRWGLRREATPDTVDEAAANSPSTDKITSSIISWREYRQRRRIDDETPSETALLEEYHQRIIADSTNQLADLDLRGNDAERTTPAPGLNTIAKLTQASRELDCFNLKNDMDIIGRRNNGALKWAFSFMAAGYLTYWTSWGRLAEVAGNHVTNAGEAATAGATPQVPGTGVVPGAPVGVHQWDTIRYEKFDEVMMSGDGAGFKGIETGQISDSFGLGQSFIAKYHPDFKIDNFNHLYKPHTDQFWTQWNKNPRLYSTIARDLAEKIRDANPKIFLPGTGFFFHATDAAGEACTHAQVDASVNGCHLNDIRVPSSRDVVDISRNIRGSLIEPQPLNESKLKVASNVIPFPDRYSNMKAA